MKIESTEIMRYFEAKIEAAHYMGTLLEKYFGTKRAIEITSHEVDKIQEESEKMKEEL